MSEGKREQSAFSATKGKFSFDPKTVSMVIILADFHAARRES